MSASLFLVCSLKPCSDSVNFLRNKLFIGFMHTLIFQDMNSRLLTYVLPSSFLFYNRFRAKNIKAKDGSSFPYDKYHIHPTHLQVTVYVTLSL